jgi:hypothetical protein
MRVRWAFREKCRWGSARGRQISASADAPKQKKNHGLSKTFPKVFTDRIERPPDGLFSTKAIQSLGPWQNKEQTPVSMSVPPIRLPGQKLFPMNKRELVTSWRKLMSQHGARTMGIGSAPSAEKSGLAPAAPPPAPPAVGAPIAARPPSPVAAPAASPPATPKVVLRPRLKAAASGDGGDKATSPRHPVVKSSEREKEKKKNKAALRGRGKR